VRWAHSLIDCHACSARWSSCPVRLKSTIGRDYCECRLNGSSIPPARLPIRPMLFTRRLHQTLFWWARLVEESGAEQIMLAERTQKAPITADDWCRGRADAPINILEYGDFECPYSRAAFPSLNAVLGEFPDTIRFIFRHFPIREVHPHAEAAAQASEAAGAQGKFWAMHDMLFTHGQQLDSSALRSYAEAIGLDVERFDQEMRVHQYTGQVDEDIHRGVLDGVLGTPALFINGVRYDGPRDYASVLAVLLSLGAGAV
jgi:protein-disulfide isomerase